MAGFQPSTNGRFWVSTEVEDERGPGPSLVQTARRHVVAGVCVNGARRQAVLGQRPGERVDQPREVLLGPARPVALAPPRGDERAQQTPRLRGPGDIGLVDVAAPRRRVVPAGGKRKASANMRSLLVADGEHAGLAEEPLRADGLNQPWQLRFDLVEGRQIEAVRPGDGDPARVEVAGRA